MNPKIKILIVEDEALIAAALKLSLQDLGYEVTDQCYTYAQAAALLPTTTADLVILDINLGSAVPGQDGLALAALLSKSNPKPFIFLTAYNDADTITKATAHQPSNYLIKPVNPAALFAAIQIAISRAQEPASAVLLPQEAPDYFYIKVGTKTHRLFWEDIYCIESGKNYVKLLAINQAGEYPVRGTLSFVLERLVPQQLQSSFFRLSRAVYLNKAHVTTFNTEVIVCGDREFANTRFSEAELHEIVKSKG